MAIVGLAVDVKGVAQLLNFDKQSIWKCGSKIVWGAEGEEGQS